MDLTPELTELEVIALLGHDEEIVIPELPLSPADLREEIRLVLRGKGKIDVLRVPEDDLGRVCTNLRSLLDDAETTVGRPRVASAYHAMQAGSDANADSTFSGAADIYRRARDRYTRPSLRPLEPRIKLAAAALSALRDAHELDDGIQGFLHLFQGTRVLRHIEDTRNSSRLREAGLALSNAWWTICEALENELSLSHWFEFNRTEVAREQVPIEEFLGCDRVFDFSAAGAISDLIASGDWRRGLPVHAWPDTTFEPVATEGYDSLNLRQHVHDLGYAPSVSLFRQRYWDGPGRVWTPGEDEERKPYRLAIWREVQLALLPDSEGKVAPYLLNRQRVTVYDDDGREIAVEYPFTRVFGEVGIIPLAIGKDRLAVFEPRELSPDEDLPMGVSTSGEVLMAPSCTSQFAQVWGARSTVIPLFLRHVRDAAVRPVDPKIEALARSSPSGRLHFLPGTVGELVERATLVPNRAGGIGGALRRDFLGKVEALRRKSGKEFLSPAPFAFEQAWS